MITAATSFAHLDAEINFFSTKYHKLTGWRTSPDLSNSCRRFSVGSTSGLWAVLTREHGLWSKLPVSNPGPQDQPSTVIFVFRRFLQPTYMNGRLKRWCDHLKRVCWSRDASKKHGPGLRATDLNHSVGQSACTIKVVVLLEGEALMPQFIHHPINSSQPPYPWRKKINKSPQHNPATTVFISGGASVFTTFNILHVLTGRWLETNRKNSFFLAFFFLPVVTECMINSFPPWDFPPWAVDLCSSSRVTMGLFAPSQINVFLCLSLSCQLR